MALIKTQQSVESPETEAEKESSWDRAQRASESEKSKF